MNQRKLLWMLALVSAVVVCLAVLVIVPHANEPVQTPQDESSCASSEQQALSDTTLEIICPQFSTAADAFLLTTKESAVLIDTGEDTSALTLLALLKDKGITSLDALILTHFDKDHIGGAAAILKAVEVKALYRTGFTTNSEPYQALLSAVKQTGQVVQTLSTETAIVPLSEENLTLTLYPPLKTSYKKKEDNNASIITGVQWGKANLLFMGDAEKLRIKEFLDEQYNGTDYELLKVAHHGRDAKQLEKLLERITPSQAIITSSIEEPEEAEVLSALQDKGCETWLTRKGTVCFTCEADGTITAVPVVSY